MQGHKNGQGETIKRFLTSSSLSSEQGNVFFALFGAIAVVGILGAGIMATMRGPLSTMVQVQSNAKAESEMAIASRLVLLEATELANNGDCDTDNFIEPLEYSDAGGNGPVGGGFLPSAVGSTRVDPWGTEYGYCAWDAGVAVNDAANCDLDGVAGNQRLDGNTFDDSTYTVIALISAGPDQVFDTSCVGGATPSVSKGGDDLVVEYTYAEASAATGGLWKLKSGEPGTAEISKELEVSGNIDLSLGGAGTGQLILGAASMLLPDESTLATCNLANKGLIRINSATNPDTLQICSEDTNNPGTYDWWGVSSGSTGLWSNGTGDKIYYDATTPQVGIGKTDPSEALDVVGNIAASGNVTAGGNLSGVDLSASGNGTIGGTLGVTGTSSLAAVNASGAADFDSTLNADGATTLGSTLGVSGATTLSSTLNATGAVDFDSTLNVDGNTTLSVLNATGAVDFDSTLNVDGDTTLAGDVDAQGTISNSSGNVDIGDDLDVSGNVDATGDLIGNNLDIATNADIDGTLEADEYTWNGNDFTPPTCSSGEYSWWDGNSWECAADQNDGSGVGSSVTVAGIFEVNETPDPDVVRMKTGIGTGYGTVDFVFGSPQLDDDGDATHQSRLFFDKSKYAFRAGYTSGDSWDDANVGIGSVAMGADSRASGQNSIAIGSFSWATGNGSMGLSSGSGTGAYSTGIGYGTLASGDYSFALGNTVIAGNGTAGSGFGDYAMAIGLGDQTGTAPRVTGDHALGIFMGDQSGYNLSTNNRMALIGGDFLIDNDGALGSQGCIRYSGTALEFSDDCTSFTAFADIGGTPGGADTQVQYNDNGNFAGDAGLTYDDANNILTVGNSVVITGQAGNAPTFIALDDLDDVTISGVADGECLVYDNGSGDWVNGSCSAGGSGNRIIDADNDTQIQVEESADEDTIRFDTAGAERVVIDTTGDVTIVDGNLRLDGGAGDDAGCIRYDDAADELQYSNDCSTYSSLSGSGSSVFEVTGGAGTELVRQVAADAPLATSDFVFGSTQLADTGTADHDSRFFFDKSKGAFRAGYVDADQWDDANVGNYSAAFGAGNTAGQYSLVGGQNNTVGSRGFSTGQNNSASGATSVAIGYANTSNGNRSAVIGSNSWASGSTAIALGQDVGAEGEYSMAIGLGDAVWNGGANTRPYVTGNHSLGIFMGPQDGYILSTANRMALVGGDLLIDDAGATGSQGCIRYNGTNSELEYSDDCTTYTAFADIGAAPTVDEFVDLNDTPATLTGQGGLYVRVNSGETSLEFTDQIVNAVTGQPAPAFAGLDDLSDVVLTAPANAECLVYDGAQWENGSCSSGSSVFEVTGGAGTELVRQVAASAPLATSDFVFGSTQLDDTGDANHDSRMFFDKSKGAFRAGYATGNHFDAANVGNYSAAFGERNRVAGQAGFAAGTGNTASGTSSIALGENNTASGNYAVALGYTSTASGYGSFARGYGSTASGSTAVVIGGSSIAAADASIVLGGGNSTTATTGNYSLVMGFDSVASGLNSVLLGRKVTTTSAATHSAALGLGNPAGANPQVSGDYSFGIFMGDQSGIDLAAANTMSVMGGDFIVGSYQLDDTTTGNQDRRMFFDVSKGAFRAGEADGDQWDDANVGVASTAFGGAQASGAYSFAVGENWATRASGYGAVKIGASGDAAGSYSFASGSETYTNGWDAVAFGQTTRANGDNSVAFGLGEATGTYPIVSANNALAVFFGDQSGYDHATSNRMALVGGDLLIDDAGATGSQGCIRYDGTNSKLQYSHDCTTYADMGAASGVTSLADADNDTLIQVEETADEDHIRFDTAGTERMVIDATGGVLISGNMALGGAAIDANRAINTQKTSTATGSANHIYGTYNSLTVQNGHDTVDARGVHNYLVIGDDYNTGYGAYNTFALNNYGAEGVGVYNDFTSSGSSNAKYSVGMQNEYDTQGWSDRFYGVLNNVTHSGDWEAYGLFNNMNSNSSTDPVYGVYNRLKTTDAASIMYGTYTIDIADGTSTAGTQYGLYVDLDDPDTTNYSVYVESGSGISYFGSNVGIGSATAPRVSLDVNATDAIIVPVGTDAQRPGTPAAGMLRYNTDASGDVVEYYDAENTTWKSFATTAGSALWTDNTTHITRGNFHVLNAGLAAGSTTAGLDGDGTYSFYDPDKGAMRGGTISGGNDAWEDANIADNSFAWGTNVEASNGGLLAIGDNVTATTGALAIGGNITASQGTIAFGGDLSSYGLGAVAIGNNATSGGNSSIAIGSYVYATAGNAIAMGISTDIQAASAVGIGNDIWIGNTAPSATAIGHALRASGEDAVVFGETANVTGENSMAVGLGEASAPWPVVSAANSLGIFMGDQSAYDLSTANRMALVGGHLMIDDAGASGSQGCIRYDGGNSKLQYSHDCSTYSDLGGGGGGAINDLSDAMADLATNGNMFIGHEGTSITAGSGLHNLGIGYTAADSLTTGDENVALGRGALTTATTASDNTAIGNYALYYVNTDDNTAIGSGAMRYYGGAGTANTAIGVVAGPGGGGGGTGDAANNVAIGFNSLSVSHAGSNNVGVGNYTLRGNIAKDESTAVGYQSMRYADNTTTNSISYNTALGAYSLRGSTTPADNTGTANTAIGHNALASTTSGSRNTAVGRGALPTVTTSSDNVAVGYYALLNVATGNGANTAIGTNALFNATGENNTVLGYGAGDNITTGGYNIIIGSGVDAPSATANGQLNIGNTIYGDMINDYVGIGTDTPEYRLDVPAVTGGMGEAARFYDTVDGGVSDVLTIQKQAATGGAGIVFKVGGASGNVEGRIYTDATDMYVEGMDNLHLTAGNDYAVKIDTSQNVGIGDFSADTIDSILHLQSGSLRLDGGAGNEAGCFDYDDTADELRYSDDCTTFAAINAIPSDKRLKTDITPLSERGNMLEKIAQIDTYSYRLKDKENARTQFGVIAQELEEIFPEIVNTADDERGTKSVRYIEMIAPMIEATKELKAENDALKTQMNDLAEQVAVLNKVAGQNVDKASMSSYFMLLIGLAFGFGVALLIRRKQI